MAININCLEYLMEHSFIRNVCFEKFVERNNFQIQLSNLVCYCVGIIDETRIVHAIRIIGQSAPPGVTSYYVEWFNTATYTLKDLQQKNIEFDSTCFWVHSGVALRKNFFLFDDRMSLMKSTFIYDERSYCYYRLACLLPFLKFEYIPSERFPIYSSPVKIYFTIRRNKKNAKVVPNKKQANLQKALKKVMKIHNSFHYLEKEHKRLFEEISNVINR